MALDPRTPVLVGAAALTQRVDDPSAAAEAIVLMEQALLAAADDAGSRALLDRIDVIAVPNGTWSYPDPGRLLAERAGASARTVLAEVGVLQQTLITRAASDIAAGRVRVVAICGGEAKHRSLRAAITGAEAPETSQPPGTEPDELLLPDGDILTATEIERELAVPAHQYALVESALRAAAHRSPAQHRAALGALWSRFAAVAARNPLAWSHDALPPEAIVTPTATNRMVATPYTKLLCSQWNVDQAAALLLCSVEVAGALGIERDRWVFPLVAAESNLMVPLPCRRSIGRWPAFRACARAAFEAAGCDIDDVAHLDLYSCFPAAVQVQAAELGLSLDDPRGLTVTGGMTFAGGPLNNYVLQAMVAMAQRLRADPRSRGAVTSVSGMLTKPGIGLWSSEAPRGPFQARDVTAEAAAATEVLPLDPDLTGDGVILACTVIHDRGEPGRAVAVVEAGGARSVVVSSDRDVAARLADRECCGVVARLDAPGQLSMIAGEDGDHTRSETTP
ncbi:hypothetical protein [Rhabdothermincola sediminis]|uniref:hypothetical protein n=1 Tax=Rhabdothermincola sediminis TaxID=2751370 RepID=UPI001AA059C3|nr:hypothetical protein [Rhabdothermincola sediminis]